jgi:hypothetical protein
MGAMQKLQYTEGYCFGVWQYLQKVYLSGLWGSFFFIVPTSLAFIQSAAIKEDSNVSWNEKVEM